MSNPIERALAVAEAEARDLFDKYVQAARSGTHEQYRMAQDAWRRQHQRVAELAEALADFRLDSAVSQARKTRDLCQDCWQDENPSEYAPVMTREDVCARCGVVALVIRTPKQQGA